MGQKAADFTYRRFILTAGKTRTLILHKRNGGQSNQQHRPCPYCAFGGQVGPSISASRCRPAAQPGCAGRGNRLDKVGSVKTVAAAAGQAAQPVHGDHVAGAYVVEHPGQRGRSTPSASNLLGKHQGAGRAFCTSSSELDTSTPNSPRTICSTKSLRTECGAEP